MYSAPEDFPRRRLDQSVGQLPGRYGRCAPMRDATCHSGVTTPSSEYDGAFFDRIEAGSLSSARVVVPMIIDLLAPKSVIDVGCGRGAWLKVFAENGVCEMDGIDGAHVNPAELLID